MPLPHGASAPTLLDRLYRRVLLACDKVAEGFGEVVLLAQKPGCKCAEGSAALTNR